MAVLDIGLRASLVLLIALLASAALRRRSAALRHWVLAAGIFAAALVAPLGMALPTWDLPQPAPFLETPLARISRDQPPLVHDSATVAANTGKTVAPTPLPVGPIAAAVWAAGFAVSVILMLASLHRLVRVTRRATPITEQRWIGTARELGARLNLGAGVALLKTDLPGMLGTWGWRRPVVLLPPHCESWSDHRIRIVLAHELAHIRRSDWAIQIAAELVRSAFWYNPLFWIACTRLRGESEQACDDGVLDAGVAAEEYASHLLEIAKTCRPPASFAALVPMARRSTLEWRITAMLNTTLTRRRPTRRALALAVAVIAGVAVPAASYRAIEQTPPMPLTGAVYDMSGAVLPQVTVTLDDASGARMTATTDSSGRFDLGVVAPGRYMLSSGIMGFMTNTQEVTLQDARNWERAITLQVGTLQETITVRDQRPSGAPASRGRGPVRIGGNIRAPLKLVDVRPVYPQAMRDAGFEGVVPLGALIGVDGRVSSVRVMSAQAHPDLARAALDAVRQWQFSPTLLNGEAVEVFMTVTVSFTLQD